MPGYQAHLAAGAVAGGAGLFAAAYTGHLARDPQAMAPLLAVCLLASLFPDVDTDSKGKRIFYGLLLVLDGYLLYRGDYKMAAFLGLFAILPGISAHRGWTHTWWAALCFPLPFVALAHYFLGVSWESALPWYLASLVGYFSHLAIDREW